MKILILSQWCYPEPDLKCLTFAKELVRQNCDVKILTGFPNYPGGKVYDGYKLKLFQRETIDGIEILRVPLYPNHSKSGLKRILNYLSFAISAALIGVFTVEKADVLYAYHPPATIAIPALIIKFFRGIPVVYDIQDIWPDSLEHSGMVNKGSFILRVMSWYGKMSYKLVDQIIVLSEGFKNLLISRGVSEHKIEVIPNWANDIPLPDSNFDIPRKRSELGFNDKFVVLYAGNMGPGQAMESVINAFYLIKETHPELLLALIGGGLEVETLKKIAKEFNLTNVIFLERVPSSKIGEILIAADILLVHLKSDELSDITIPSKTQAYMMLGKPILIGVKGEAANLVQSANAGLVCEPENINDIATKIVEASTMDKTLLHQMGENGNKFYNSNMSISIGSSKFITLFRSMLDKK